jgi:universal stress protein E
MSRYQDILVHLGGEDAPWRAALPLARAGAGRLTLVEVLGDPPPQLVNQGAGACVTLEERWRRDQLAHLARVAERLMDEDVDVHTRLLEGDESGALLDALAAGGHDLLVRQAEQGLGQDRLSLAADDRSLLRRSPRPVWLVKPRVASGGRVLVAVDTRADDDARAELNAGLVAAGAELAGRLDLELHLASVIEPGDEASTARLAELGDSVVPAVPAERRQLLHGEAADELVAAVADGSTAVLVLGALSRAGDDRLEVGHTAERVLARAACSVLSVRPEAVGSSLPV